MKLIHLLIFLSLFSTEIFADQPNTDKEQKFIITEKTDEFNIYGDPWPHQKTAFTPVAEAIKNKQLGTAQVFSGEITKVCQKVGCWMILTQEGSFARVDFDNHRFFIPKDSHGKADVFGTMKTKKLSKKQKTHYQSDGATFDEDFIYEIVADSVKIYAHHSN